MNFEQAYANLSVSKMEDFYTKLQKYLDPELSREQLERYASTINHKGDIFVQDENQRRRRAEVSKKMREAMVDLLENSAKANIERKKTKRIDLVRQLGDDTLLLLPHEEQNEEYERRYNILVSGTPEEKRKLLFDALHEAQKGYTPEKLMSLTDEEIAEDFENLYRLQQYANACVALSGMEMLKLSDEEKKELLDFEEKFSVLATGVSCRAQVISAPYYELIRPEKLINKDGENLVGEPPLGEGNFEEEKSFHNVYKNLGTYVNFGIDHTARFLVKQGIAGYDVNEVIWMTQDGGQVLNRNPKGEIIPFGEVPSAEITKGNSLIAVLPDGKMREFSLAVDESGRFNFNVKENVTEKSLSAIDENIHNGLVNLSKDLEQVDHWYIRSSPEFKNIKNHLETIQKEWKDMGSRSFEFKKNKLRSQMEALNDFCDKYMNNKEKKQQEDGLNSNDEERLEAIKKISSYARQQLQFCNSRNSVAQKTDVLDKKSHIVFEEQLDSVLNENERKVLTDNGAEFKDVFLVEVQNSIMELSNADKGMFTGSSQYSNMQQCLSEMADRIEDMGGEITWDSVEDLSDAFRELKSSTESYLRYKSDPKNCSGSDREKQRIAAAEKLKKLCDKMQPKTEEIKTAMERPGKEGVKLRVAEVVNQKYSSQESSKEMQQLCNNIRNDDAYARYIENPTDQAVKDTVVRHMAEMVAVEHLGILKKRQQLQERTKDNPLLGGMVSKAPENAKNIIAEVGVDKYVDLIMNQKDFKEAVENLEPHKMCIFVYGDAARNLAVQFDRQIMQIAQAQKQQNSIAHKEAVDQKQAEMSLNL